MVTESSTGPRKRFREMNVAQSEIAFGQIQHKRTVTSGTVSINWNVCLRRTRNLGTSEDAAPDSKESRVGASRGNLDEDLRRGRQSSPCMAFGALRMITLPRINSSKVQRTTKKVLEEGSELNTVLEDGSQDGLRDALLRGPKTFVLCNKKPSYIDLWSVLGVLALFPFDPLDFQADKVTYLRLFSR